MLIKDIDDLPDDSKAEKKVLIEKANFSRRFFTVQCIHNMETLVLTFKDIEIIKKDFQLAMSQFIKQNIKQTL